MVAAGKQARLAALWSMKEVGQLQIDAKMTCWSMVRFLIDEHGDKLAQFLGGVKGQLDEQQQPTGRDLPDLQRRLLRELWGWSSVELDQAWLAWVNR